MGRRKENDYDKLTPPYLSYGYFKDSIEYFKKLELKENDRIVWEVFDFKVSVKQRLCLAYKFLGFITPTEDITSVFLSFLSGDIKLRQSLIINAYFKFFLEGEDYFSMNKSDFRDTFKKVYGLKGVGSSIAFFSALLRDYGFYDEPVTIDIDENIKEEKAEWEKFAFSISQFCFKINKTQRTYLERFPKTINAVCKVEDGKLYVLFAQ